MTEKDRPEPSKSARNLSRMPENSVFYEKVVPALLVIMGVIMVVIVLVVAGIIFGVIKF